MSDFAKHLAGRAGCADGSGHVIATVKPESWEAGLNEIASALPRSRLEARLGPGVGVVRLHGDFGGLCRAWRIARPVFVQHIFPLHAALTLAGDGGDLERITQASEDLMGCFDPARTFSVQTRRLGDGGHAIPALEVSGRIADRFTRTGAALRVQDPEQVISVVIAGDSACLGLSDSADNLSAWAGGMRRYAVEPDRISRAEFKLLEALEYFKLDLREAVSALDLGASPGGWTRVLLSRGLKVTAVDPAELDPSLRTHPHLSARRETAQAFLRGDSRGRPFDLVVNDMKMDTRESVELMNAAASRLRPSGLAILTLKLGRRHIQSTVAQALDGLRKEYALIGARQLFHNRSEVTVAARRIARG